jgi:ribosomal protein L19
MEVEAFITRVVESLQGRVIDQRRLQQFAGTWMSKARQVSYDTMQVKRTYDDMIAEIRREAQLPGSWVTVGAGPGSIPQQTVDASGWASVTQSGNSIEVEKFIERVIGSIQGCVVDKQRLPQFANTWMSQARQVSYDTMQVGRTYDNMIAEIRREAQMPGSWIMIVDASSWQRVVQSGNPMEVEKFIERVVESLQGRVVDPRRLQQFASTWMSKARQVSYDTMQVNRTYDDMIAEIRREAQMPGSWVSLGAGLGSTPQQSPDGNGWASVTQSGNSMEVEKFIERVVESLQGRVVDQRRLQQFASTWMSKARQVSYDAMQVKRTYDDMIAEIRREAQMPGSWVTVGSGLGSAPHQSPDASGWASVTQSGNSMEVEKFIERVL